MKILFISSDNNATSGAFLSMVKLNTILNKCYGVETKIILPKKGTGEMLLKTNDINYEYIYSFSWIVKCKRKGIREKAKYILKILLQFYNLIAVKKIVKLLKKEHYDLVHINTTYAYSGALAAHKVHIPIIWHLREFLEEDKNVKIINRKYGYKLINKSNVIVTISNSIYEKYRSIFRKEELKMIYNGIDVKKFYQKRDIFQTNILNLVIVGNIAPEKGQIDLIKACALLKKDGVIFQLNVIGNYENAYKRKLEELINKSCMGKSVYFYGPQKNVEKFLRKSDIAFVCSKSEAFGRVTVEALLSGCLVIGADTAGTSEILQNGLFGLLYQYGNEFDLYEKIVYADKNRKKMSDMAHKGQEYAVQNFSDSRNAEEIYSLYKKIVV